jgi:hypothetical protein
MRKWILCCLFLALGFAATASAQDHGTFGIYGDYTRISQTGTDMAGIGGRLGVNLASHLALEAQMTYDFSQVFNESFRNALNGTVSVQQSNIRLLQGLFGPTLETAHGPVRFFVTAKGGFIDFLFDPRPVSFNTFASSVANLRSHNVNGVFYPGAGAEIRLWHIGLRLEAGDDMYFNNGIHHNLRVMGGPFISF